MLFNSSFVVLTIVTGTVILAGFTTTSCALISPTTSERQPSERCVESCINKTIDVVMPVNTESCLEHDCLQRQCTVGCSLWNVSIDGSSSCSQKCMDKTRNESVKYRDVTVCVVGCLAAEAEYIFEITVKLSSFPAPTLVARSRTNQSVILEWAGLTTGAGTNLPGRSSALIPTSEGFEGLITMLQKQIVGLSEEWVNHADVKWLPRGRLKVLGLHPHTTYRFRVLAVFDRNGETFLLKTSVPIATEQYGAPAQAPELLSAKSTATSIHLRWKAPFYINAPLIAYHLKITTNDNQTRGSDAVKRTASVKSPEREKDVTALSSIVSEIVTLLQPDTDYVVEIVAVNGFGKSPVLRSSIRTLPQSSGDYSAGELIVGMDNRVLKQNLYFSQADGFPEPDILFEDPDPTTLITDISIHYEYRLVYFITSNDECFLKNDSSKSSAARLVYNSTGPLSSISVDWLHHRLYIVDDNQLIRCNLHVTVCRQLSLAETTLKEPMHIQVDPYNGYFYWTEREGSSLLRIDIADILSTRQNITTKHVVLSGEIPAFAVDYANYRIFFPANETRPGGAFIISVDLDGSDATSTRQNLNYPSRTARRGSRSGRANGFKAKRSSGQSRIPLAQSFSRSRAKQTRSGMNNKTEPVESKNKGSGNGFGRKVVMQDENAESIVALVYYVVKSTFLWTDGRKVYMEEYDAEINVFNQNELLDGKEITAICVWQSLSQPRPVPISGPDNLRVLTTNQSAAVSWTNIQSDQGRGAWINWSYELLFNTSSTENTSITNITETRVLIGGLLPSTVYSFYVRGFSTAGYGPWSTEFTTTTLQTDSVTPYILYAGGPDASIFEAKIDNCCQQQDLTIINNVTLQHSYSPISDLLISGDQYYLAIGGHILVGDWSSIQPMRTKRETRTESIIPSKLMSHIYDATLLEFDWMTDTLYWISARINTIQRLNLNDMRNSTASPNTFSPSSSYQRHPSAIESIHHSVSSINDFKVDSANATLYWATSQTIESSKLNGKELRTLVKLRPFSGLYVLGLTLDLVGQMLYWVIVHAEQFQLYRCRLDDVDRSKSMVMNFSLAESTDHGPVRMEFYSDKVFLLGSKNRLSVLDLRTKSVARVTLITTSLVPEDNNDYYDSDTEDARNDDDDDDNDEDDDVKAFILIHQNKYPIPDFFMKGVTSLIPSASSLLPILLAVDEETEGRLNVSWSSSSVDYGTVYYALVLLDDKEKPKLDRETSGTWMSIKGFKSSTDFAISVRACTYWGCSAAVVKEISMATAAAYQSQQEQTTVALLSSLGVLLAMTVFVAILLAITCQSRKRQQTMLALLDVNHMTNGRDQHLATLRQLPRVVLEADNTLYSNNVFADLETAALLPRFQRDRLRLTKFLGSGAFGEVFEGVATNILHETSGETNVAVKTLRKGACDSEKEEFLKEAVLMSHFKHEHIISLLGVCFEDPQFIILELMQGGDLLSCLRASRPTMTRGPSLTLREMVGICLDVALGCQYLEDLHFVHRDLASRNCLIAHDPVVGHICKIGDFGLARDMYKNDYYRKEGEGLLPVRWMSPESLVDGVFTTQSDIWAFGVLMWEVLTFGQQPYPARTNLEVLNFIRSGGHPDRPDRCSDELYSLMCKCWMYMPESRPSFHYTVVQLETIKQNVPHDAVMGAGSRFWQDMPSFMRAHHQASRAVTDRDRVRSAIDFSDDSVSGSGEFAIGASRNKVQKVNSLTPLISNRRSRPLSDTFDYNNSNADLTSVDSDLNNVAGYLQPTEFHRGYLDPVSVDDYNRQYLEQPPLPISNRTLANDKSNSVSSKPQLCWNPANDDAPKYLELFDEQFRTGTPRIANGDAARDRNQLRICTSTNGFNQCLMSRNLLKDEGCSGCKPRRFECLDDSRPIADRRSMFAGANPFDLKDNVDVDSNRNKRRTYYEHAV